MNPHQAANADMGYAIITPEPSTGRYLVLAHRVGNDLDAQQILELYRRLGARNVFIAWDMTWGGPFRGHQA